MNFKTEVLSEDISMIFFLFLCMFTFSQEQILYAPQGFFRIASVDATIRDHLVNAQNKKYAEKYKDYLDFFMWQTISPKNHNLTRFTDKKSSYGSISKYRESYMVGHNLIRAKEFSVIQFESDEIDALKTFVILNFTSKDSRQVNHLMDMIKNIYQKN